MQKPLVEKTSKFQINNSDNSSTIQIAATIKKKEEFSDSTQRTVQPKVYAKRREEALSRKAISSLNFLQQCSKPLNTEKILPEKMEKAKIAINNFFVPVKPKKKFCLRDLMDEWAECDNFNKSNYKSCFSSVYLIPFDLHFCLAIISLIPSNKRGEFHSNDFSAKFVLIDQTNKIISGIPRIKFIKSIIIHVPKRTRWPTRGPSKSHDVAREASKNIYL